MANIYILSPIAQTGGIEAIFQLSHKLYKIGHTCKIFPMRGKIDINDSNTLISEEKNKYPHLYDKYKSEWSSHIHLEKEDYLIIPEVYIKMASNFRKLDCKKFIWWLSVDNAFAGFDKDWQKHPFFADGTHYSFGHLYQSQYALNFLEGVGACDIFELKCYIGEEFIKSSIIQNERDDIILYNPKKDSVYWEILRDQCKGMQFTPLQGMTREKMIETIQSSKIYIDFGSHPGMDRIPRETALNGTVVLTGKRGAANNSVDIPIPDFFKFDTRSIYNGHCAEMLMAILKSHKKYLSMQDYYRRSIRMQERAFENAVFSLWGEV